MSASEFPECIFCKIVAGEIPATIVAERDEVLAMRDISPVGPTHVLVIPRRHLKDATEVGVGEAQLLGEMFELANEVAKAEGIAEAGFRLIANVGDAAGNTVAHLHLHLIGGRDLSWPPG
jgi:histidine triad (HIT) family protein